MPHVKIQVVSSKKSDSLTLPFKTDEELERFLISLADASAISIMLQLAEAPKAKPVHNDVPVDVIIMGFDPLPSSED